MDYDHLITQDDLDEFAGEQARIDYKKRVEQEAKEEQKMNEQQKEMKAVFSRLSQLETFVKDMNLKLKANGYYY